MREGNQEKIMECVGTGQMFCEDSINEQCLNGDRMTGLRLNSIIRFLICQIVLLVMAGTAQGGSESGATSGQRIAFVANLDGNWDLFTAFPDGSSLKQWTKTPYDESSPAWSGDKQFLAFSATDGSLRILDMKSGKIREYRPNSNDLSYGQPSFSPDGQSLSLSVHYKEATERADIGILDLATETLDIPLAQKSLQLFPSWADDGSVICYTFVTCNVECGRIIQEIWSLPRPDGYPRQELLTNSHCQSPEISPDGSALVYSSNQNGAFDIWKYDYSNHGTVQLTADPAMDIEPTWSRDGELVAFTSTRTGRYGVHLLNVKSRTIEAFEPFGESPAECREPDF